jgi:hypothetical protein
MLGILRAENRDVSRSEGNLRAEREAFERKRARESAAFEARQAAEMDDFKQRLEALAHSMKPAGKLVKPTGIASMFT